jgi:hypothetical protein
VTGRIVGPQDAVYLSFPRVAAARGIPKFFRGADTTRVRYNWAVPDPRFITLTGIRDSSRAAATRAGMTQEKAESSFRARIIRPRSAYLSRQSA